PRSKPADSGELRQRTLALRVYESVAIPLRHKAYGGQGDETDGQAPRNARARTCAHEDQGHDSERMQRQPTPLPTREPLKRQGYEERCRESQRPTGTRPERARLRQAQKAENGGPEVRMEREGGGRDGLQPAPPHRFRASTTSAS